MVVMDWTDFDADGQTTLVLSKVTPHGRATPLLWLTVMKDDLKNKRNAYEDACLKRLGEVLPGGIKVTILADRGFGDTKLFSYLGTLGFDYVIRFRGNTHVTATTGERRPGADWVGKGGRAVKLSGAALTASEHPVGAVVCVQVAYSDEAGRVFRALPHFWCSLWGGAAQPTQHEQPFGVGDRASPGQTSDV